MGISAQQSRSSCRSSSFAQCDPGDARAGSVCAIEARIHTAAWAIHSQRQPRVAAPAGKNASLERSNRESLFVADLRAPRRALIHRTPGRCLYAGRSKSACDTRHVAQRRICDRNTKACHGYDDARMQWATCAATSRQLPAGALSALRSMLAKRYA